MCLIFAEAAAGFIKRPELESAFLTAQGVLSCLFVLVMMFIFVNKRQLILERLSPQCSSPFLAFIVWCSMICLFTQILICFPTWSDGKCPE
ncbi:unnamed protein product [Trichobilharzia szidati]|nr:unnamed protein product [Trichobilharzia szidati]